MNDVHKRPIGGSVSCDGSESNDSPEVQMEVSMGKHVGLASGVSLIVGSVIGEWVRVRPPPPYIHTLSVIYLC